MQDNKKHHHYLLQALALSQAHRGQCAPNPAVGALVVKDNHIISTGITQGGPGSDHAEVVALKAAQQQAEGAILYVTLEPCCHWGRTPPCTTAIIQSGIRTVYYGQDDPNPQVREKSIVILKKAGIACHAISLSEITQFFTSYVYWTTHQRPWVTAKLAMSLDGKIALKDHQPAQITGEAVQQYTHTHRYHSDAILTTSATILADNPQLNARLNNKEIKKKVYVLDAQLRFPLNARLLETAKSIHLFHAPIKNEQTKSRELALKSKKITCTEITYDRSGLALNEVLTVIGENGIHDLWVEAGGVCFESLLQKQLIHRAIIYIAPKILGQEALPGLTQPYSFLSEQDDKVCWQSCGQDMICDIDLSSSF